MPATPKPPRTSERMIATVASVFPTPVSVPATKNPWRVRERGICMALPWTPPADGVGRDPHFPVRGTADTYASGRTPRGSVDDLVCRGQPAIAPESFVGGTHLLHSGLTGESSRPTCGDVVGGDCFEVAHQRGCIRVSHLQAIDIQHRFTQAGADERIADVVHVQEMIYVIVAVHLSPCGTKFLER